MGSAGASYSIKVTLKNTVLTRNSNQYYRLFWPREFAFDLGYNYSVTRIMGLRLYQMVFCALQSTVHEIMFLSIRGIEQTIVLLREVPRAI